MTPKYNSDACIWICQREAIKHFKWKGEGSQEKQKYAETGKIYGKNKPMCETVKKEKEIHAYYI